jgi:hypothetical protein
MWYFWNEIDDGIVVERLARMPVSLFALLKEGMHEV